MSDNQQERRSKLQAALLEILDEAMRIDEAACGKIRIYNPRSGSLELTAQRGFSEDFVKSFEAVPKDAGVACARAFRARRRVMVADVARDPHSVAYRPVARAEGFKSLQTAPLIGTGGRVVGTLSTHFAQPHRPSRSALLVLDYCCKRAAEAIDKYTPFAPAGAERS